jgi:DNA-binding transcriptional MerR regulator
MSKAANAFRTISEVADELAVQKHVLRFWEVKFPQIRPMKRGGGRRYYRPEDMVLLRGIQHLLHAEGYTIKGVQKILREQGVEQVKVHGVAAIAAAEAVIAPVKGGRKATPATAATVGGRVRALPKAASARDASAKAVAAKAVKVPAGKAKAADVPPMAASHRAVIERALRELVACREALTLAGSVRSAAPASVAPKARTARAASSR